MRATLKVMSSFLLYCPMMSEADVDGMSVEVEQTHQHLVTLCWHVRDGSRRAACLSMVYRLVQLITKNQKTITFTKWCLTSLSHSESSATIELYPIKLSAMPTPS